MKRGLLVFHFLTGVWLLWQTAAWAGQAPGAASDPDIPVSHRDRDVTGAIRQVVHGEDKIECRYLLIAEGHADNPRAARQS